MKCRSELLRGLICWMLIQAVRAQAEPVPEAEDFLPLVRGGSATVRAPEAVVAQDLVVSAASPQDATNAALQRQTQSLASGPGEFAAHWTIFGSGAGAVATGRATYSPYENPDATDEIQREAYVIAFHHAKRNLGRLLNETVHEGRNEIVKSLDQRINPERTSANSETKSVHEIRQKLSSMLKAFVVYSVADQEFAGHPGQRQVLVTVAVSPKTMGKVRHDASNRVQADSLATGVREVLTEIQNGLVPPIGGQVITVPSTGETAFVGFSSILPATFASSEAAATLATEMETVAEEEALDSLSGLLLGDELMWEVGVRREVTHGFRNFQKVAADDPLKALDPEGVQLLNQEQRLFMSKFTKTESYRSVRQGHIPPGTQIRTWRKDRRLNAVAVYVPSWTDTAVRFADDMRSSELVRPYSLESTPRSTTSEQSKTSGASIGRPTSSGREFEPGPTGIVQPKEKL